MKRYYLTYSCIFFLASCGGGNGDSTPPANPPVGPPPAPVANTITVSNCTPSGDDSFIDPQVAIDTAGDRETNFVRSHSVGSPTYHFETTRYLADGSSVTIDYMVHTPLGTPKGIVLLIAGGGLNAGVTGTLDGNPSTGSRGNYLVRSAHRFMNGGYKVITIDRPSDYVNYNLVMGSYLYDQYRASMDHAVDLSKVINRENTGNWPIFIAGTSRGAISAVANNTLTNGISLSSPVTFDNPALTEDAAVGSAALPISMIERDVHLLLHTNDGCNVSTPQASRDLFAEIDTAGIPIIGNEVTGGFSDSYRNAPCDAFDFHGFVGIENCAVSKETDWMDTVVASLTAGTNSTPVANNGAFMETDSLDVSTLVNDADADTLIYTLPYTNSALGGTVSINSGTGIVTYTAPVIATGVLDSIAYVVTDGNGGVDTAVITIEKE